MTVDRVIRQDGAQVADFFSPGTVFTVSRGELYETDALKLVAFVYFSGFHGSLEARCQGMGLGQE